MAQARDEALKEPVDVVWSMTMSDPATFQL